MEHLSHYNGIPQQPADTHGDGNAGFGATGKTQEAALHDIGKIGIDDKILNKPGKLTDEEFKIMQNHTIIGARILKNMEGYLDVPVIEKQPHG